MKNKQKSNYTLRASVKNILSLGFLNLSKNAFKGRYIILRIKTLKCGVFPNMKKHKNANIP